MEIITQLNKSIRRSLTAVQVNAGETAVIGVNILVEAERVFFFHGLLAQIKLGDATDIGNGNNLIARGLQGKELSVDMTTIAQAASPGATIFDTDVLFAGRSASEQHYFGGAPMKLFNPGFYSFFLSFLADPAILPFAGTATCILTIFGEVLSKSDKQLPWVFR